MSSLITAPPTGTGTDNHIVRWDTSVNLQDSLGIISDLGVLTGLTEIVLGNATWSQFNFITSTADFTVSSNTDFNNGSSNGNVNFLAFNGAVNIFANLDSTFGSASGAFIWNAGTTIDGNAAGDINLTSSGGGVGLTGAAGLFFNSTSNFGADAVHGANNAFFGSSNQGVMFHDGTSWVFNPKTSGSADLVIGSSSASGGNDANLRVNRLALFGSNIGGTTAINLVTTGALRSALNFVLTFDSGTIAAPFTCNLIDISTGNNIVTTNVIEYTLKTNSHTLSDATKASTLNLSTGIDASITLSPGATSEDHMLTCLMLKPNGKGVGGTHSNGSSALAIYSTGLFQKKMTAFAGAGTYTYVGGYFGDDLCMEENAKLIFDNTETDSTTYVKVTKGDHYITYSTANTALEYFANGTKVLSQTQTLNTSEVILRTLAGTSTSYARVGGTINVNSTAVGNVGTGEDDLISYTIPANTLSTNGDTIRFHMAGTFAANANNKQVKIKYGATTLLATGALAFNGVDWSAGGTIVRTGAATQKASAWFRAGATLTSFTDYTAPAETLSGTVVLKCTGEATSNNDITEEFHVVEWHPNA